MYNRYIKPWLFGEEACRSSFECLKENINSMTEQLKKLQADVARIEQRLQANYENEFTLPAPSATDLLAIQDLKSEISSIKTMMLGKNQFPSRPASGIPSWQLSRYACLLLYNTFNTLIIK